MDTRLSYHRSTGKFFKYSERKNGQSLDVYAPGRQPIFFCGRARRYATERSQIKEQVGDVRQATPEEIAKAGAAAGYASPIGLKEGIIVVDDLIPESQNLVAGANESGYHLKNTNYGRDYSAEIVADLVQAKAGDACINCGNPLSVEFCD